MELTLPDELFDRLQRIALPKIFICSWGGTSAETHRNGAWPSLGCFYTSSKSMPIC